MAADSGRSVGLPVQLVIVGRSANEGSVVYLEVVGTTVIRYVSNLTLVQSTMKGSCGICIKGYDLLW